MDWSPSSPIASEDSFQDSNDTQSSLDYLYIQQQQQQQQQQQMPQQYIYTQQQAHHQQQGRFEWLDPSLTDHIAELCLIKLQQASTGRNHSLLRQVQLNSMLHRLRMLAFFRAPLPVYPHQHFHQQQQPQPYDSSDLTASFEAGAVPPVAEMGTSADHQLVMPDPSSIASLGLQASPPPLDPVRGYDWDQEALADNQLATNLSLNVLLTLDTQQQQQQPPPPQHLQQHIEHHPSSSSAPGPEQPGIRSVASPLSHLDHQSHHPHPHHPHPHHPHHHHQDKALSQDSLSVALQPGMFGIPPFSSFPAHTSTPVTCSVSSLLPSTASRDRDVAGHSGAPCVPFLNPTTTVTTTSLAELQQCRPSVTRLESGNISQVSASSSSSQSPTDANTNANAVATASVQSSPSASSLLPASALTLPSVLFYPSSSIVFSTSVTLPPTFDTPSSTSPDTALPSCFHVPSIRFAAYSPSPDAPSISGTPSFALNTPSTSPDVTSLPNCVEITPSESQGQPSIFSMDNAFQITTPVQHQHTLQQPSLVTVSTPSTTQETVPLTTKDIMDVLSGHFPLQALTAVPDVNAGHSYQLEWQPPQSHPQPTPQPHIPSQPALNEVISPVAAAEDSNKAVECLTTSIPILPQTPETPEGTTGHGEAIEPFVTQKADAGQETAESASALLHSVEAGDHDPSVQLTVAVAVSKSGHEETAAVPASPTPVFTPALDEVRNSDMEIDMDVDTDMELAVASREIRLTSPPPSPSKRKRTVSGKSMCPKVEKRVTRSQLRGAAAPSTSDLMDILHAAEDASSSPQAPPKNSSPSSTWPSLSWASMRAKGSADDSAAAESASASSRAMKRRRSNRGGRQSQEEEGAALSSGSSSCASSPESSPPSPKTPPPHQEHSFIAPIVEDKIADSFQSLGDERSVDEPTVSSIEDQVMTETCTNSFDDGEKKSREEVGSNDTIRSTPASSRYPSRRGGLRASNNVGLPLGMSCGISLSQPQQAQASPQSTPSTAQQHRRQQGQHGRSRSLTSTGLRDAMLAAHSLGPDGPLMAGSGTSKVSAA